MNDAASARAPVLSGERSWSRLLIPGTRESCGTKEEPRVRAKDGERLRQTSIHLPVELHKRLRKYAFDQEVTLSAVMVDAIEAWLDVREG